MDDILLQPGSLNFQSTQGDESVLARLAVYPEAKQKAFARL
ncbi:hypothetical protein GCHA_2939 [Paraglaciecola chathamensis S18K6]|uniref:Uncharacterized protein n=1 Tax=Paraglaciecola chathamensis S18K6 TaxID=1127672 RepID=A0AAV3V1L4_9ALTE|nr:hypothetical protein GCHA_2939 [Paraglaciecola chathamensis S18K6]